MTPLARREARQGLLFISPWLIGFVVFTAFPIVFTLFLSFSNVELDQQEPIRLVGLDNYARVFEDRLAKASLQVTLSFAALWLPISIVVPFVVALLLNSIHLSARGAFRVLLFMPYVVPLVAGALIWNSMLGLDGWVNKFLELFGIDCRHRLDQRSRPGLPGPRDHRHLGHRRRGDHQPCRPAWHPDGAYDAAKIDGAGAWGQLRYVTIPLMTPVIFYSLILGIVGVLQYFLIPLVLTNGTGEPGGKTLFYNLYLFQQFFTFQNLSYGATLAWILFLLTLGLTLVVFWSARRWVYYAGER